MKLIHDTSPFDGSLDVVASLSDRLVHASIEELKRRDDLTIALRSLLRDGASIDDLSAACGLTCAEIRRRVEGELHLGEDLAELSGLR